MLSIIIPTYKEEKYIGRSLEALKSGLTLPHQIIVSDDKSPDATAEIARKYADIVLVQEDKHPTIAANRNYGATRTTGEFLVFMDADSMIKEPDAFFKRALAQFQDEPGLVALTACLRVLPEAETFTDRTVYAVFNWVHRLKNNVLHMGEASGKFQMIRRDAFEKVCGFREDLVTREDADMFQRLSKIGLTRCDPRLTVYHSGRRAHRFGWPKLLWIWGLELVRFAAFNRSSIDEWEAVR